MKIKIAEQVTKEGFTYLPGVYEVVEGNDFGPGQVTARMAKILMTDYPFVTEDKPKPAVPSFRSKPKK